MKTTQQIVVPIDFTKSTDILVKYANSMAEKLGAVIHFVHVVQDFPGDAMVGSPFAQDYQDKVTAASQDKMAHLIQNSQKNCRALPARCFSVIQWTILSNFQELRMRT